MKSLCLTLPLVVVLLGLSGVMGCHRNDIRVLEVSVPAMKSEECLRIVLSAFAPQGHPFEGILNIEPDIPARKLTVTYDSRRIAIKNIEYAITKAGFDANDEPAREEAQKRLPPACRP